MRWQKLKAGECHVMAYPNPADLDGDEADPTSTCEQEGLNVGYLAFNVEKKPFDDKRVRQALNMAINKQAIIEAVYQGAGKVAKNPIPPTHLVLQRRRQGLPVRSRGGQAAARRRLASRGFKTDLWAMPVQRPYNPNARRMAELIQADWPRSASRPRSSPTNGANT